MQSTTTAETLLAILNHARHQFPQYAANPAALVKISEQKIYLFVGQQLEKQYSVSTSRYGVGQEQDSNKTPIGIHCVAEKIGADAQCGEIFLARQRTHQQACIEEKEISNEEDCITTRILWLSGLEAGINQGANVDSYSRYIYIHGTHEEGLIGKPASIGCIRMKNQDVIELFDYLSESSLVIISE